MNLRNCIYTFIFAFYLLGCETLPPEKGQVVSISDGDTFTMLDENRKQTRVRLYGIDAPEKSQDFGNVAKQQLAKLIFDKNVSVIEMDVDQYGRRIAIVTVDGINVNEALLKAGLAWHYKHYDNNAMWSAFELEASSKHLGLWSEDDPTPPWEFRKAKRNHH